MEPSSDPRFTINQYSLQYLETHFLQIYRVTLKKGILVIFVSFLFEKLDFTFSHVIWNQNLEPDSSSQLEHVHSENRVP